MRALFSILVATISSSELCYAKWLGIPTVPFVKSATNTTLNINKITEIVVDTKYLNSTNTLGETLIPPTLGSFAATFAEDLFSTFGHNVTVTSACSTNKNNAAIFMTLGNASEYLDAAGRPTSEGYSLDVSSSGIVVTGASPLGVWWGTRTILQQAVLNNGTLSAGRAIDSPGWAIRGLMLDIGRHYYPADFLIEMCSYLSFFKQNTFHLHLSDSQNMNNDLSMEEKLNYYSAFRLDSNASAVAGLNRRRNESYNYDIFGNLQQKCARRGVTIIPEIEAPGHALPITQWKPELALASDFTMLNISHPDTIPTMKTIWDTFLPWFSSKTVHLGADEYASSAVTEYNYYVNTMHDYIISKHNRSVRIWGTFVPSPTAATNVNLNVSVQHWEFFEDNPYKDFIKQGYHVLNSDDQFYVVAKWSGSYPQKLNMTRIFHGAPDGGPTAPNIFDDSNATNNPPRNNSFVLGQLPALWNDFGPNSTSVIEAYYALREGLPALADKQWGGNLLRNEFDSIFETVHRAIPGQNLDRRIPSISSTILEYNFTTRSLITDLSGNGYNGTVSGVCSYTDSSLVLRRGCGISTGLSSKGRNYTLTFSVKPTSSIRGTLFSGTASSLLAGNGTLSNVMMITGGNAYVLNYTLPLNVWTDISLIGIGNATYLSTTAATGGQETVHEFLATIGSLSNSFVWGNPMAFEAPVAMIGGDNFEGELKSVKLVDGADEKYAAMVADIVIGTDL